VAIRLYPGYAEFYKRRSRCYKWESAQDESNFYTKEILAQMRVQAEEDAKKASVLNGETEDDGND
jgi:hypothetical protein